MVQQLSLLGQISESKIRRLILTLSTLTGNIHSEMNQHTVILKPRYPFTPEIVPGKVTQIESYRIRMNRIWESRYPLDISARDDIKGDSITKQKKEFLNDSIWTLQLSDIPAGGNQPVLIQNLYETTIYETDDIIGYLDELGYMHETEFWSHGRRFFYGDVIIEVLRLFIIDSQSIEEVEDERVKLKLLDDSGSYLVKAYVNVGTINDVENVTYGIKQLEKIKRILEEVIELHVPDRLAMDSRINSRIANTNRQNI